MSRTVLIDLLRRAYGIAQISAKYHVPPAEVQGLLSDRVSRRRVLQSGLAAGGILAANPWTTRPLQTLPPAPVRAGKVLVVGAGIAGLTAAYRLHQAGVPVDLVEATQRVGGRIRSIAHAAGTDAAIELGGEFIDTDHTHLQSLAAELGLEIVDLQTADADLVPGILYFEGSKVSLSAIIEAFVPLAGQIEQDLASLGDWDLTYRSPNPAAVRLDRLSLAEYLDTAPIDSTLRKLVRVAYVTELGREPEEQSCLNLLFLIGTEAGIWRVYGTSDERYHIAGGNDQIPRRLAERLADSIETGTALESIRMQADGRYQVGLRSSFSNFERTYERIVLAVPFSVLRQVAIALDLPPAKRRAIEQLGYGTNTKLITPYRERIWRTRYGSTAAIFTDLDFQSTWESTRYTPGSSGWLANFTGGNQGIGLGGGSPEAHAQALTTKLEPIFPGISQARQGRAVRAYWTGEPYQQGSYSCYLVGQWTQLAGAEAERVGNLWFAGEHCSPGAKGHMEGGCETGEAAARSILQEMGLSRYVAQSERSL